MIANSDNTSSAAAPQPRIALFPGSFDPFTRGHASIVERALQLFDHVVIAIGYNAAKISHDDISRREATIRSVYHDRRERVSVISYSGLTADAARDSGACAIVRGIRSVKDFEYERDMADINRQLSGLETVLLFSLPELAAVSSSLVRELKALGTDISHFLP